MTSGASARSADRWLAEPWAGALLHLLADPAADLDPTMVPDWPAWASLDAALADPWTRRKLGRWLTDPDPRATRQIVGCVAEPRARLALIPAADAVSLIALLGAWIEADRLSALLRPSDIEAVRSAIGGEAFAFALGPGRLLPRPSPLLAEALETASPSGEPLASERIMRRGACVFGLALGGLPPPLQQHLRLRRPAALWSEIVVYGAGRGDPDPLEPDPLGADAFSAIRRLARTASLPWSTWFA
jgi:hypothetical protein